MRSASGDNENDKKKTRRSVDLITALLKIHDEAGQVRSASGDNENDKKKKKEDLSIL